MALRIVRLGSPRAAGEGLRIGTVRRPPRGVKKQDYARENHYDAWLPELAPSAALLAFAHGGALTGTRWAAFAKRYRAEMKKPETQRLLGLLAALSARTNLSVGCYCEDESRCHRSLLKELLVEHGAQVSG